MFISCPSSQHEPGLPSPSVACGVARPCEVVIARLSLLGAQARLGERGTAWVPLLDNYLACRLAKAPAALTLPVMIPLLNVLVGAHLGTGMAKAAGAARRLACAMAFQCSATSCRSSFFMRARYSHSAVTDQRYGQIFTDDTLSFHPLGIRFRRLGPTTANDFPW